MPEAVTLPAADLSVIDHGSQTSPEKAIAVIALAQQGVAATSIAQQLHMDSRTVRGVLEKYAPDAATEAKLLLSSHAVSFAADWLTASQKAAKSGNHQPAKDALLLTRAIDPLPQQTAAVQVGVQIVLGTPDTPVTYTPFTVIDQPQPQTIAAAADTTTVETAAVDATAVAADIRASVAPSPDPPPGPATEPSQAVPTTSAK